MNVSVCCVQVEELQLKFRPHCELEWEASLQALSAFDMSVEKAACAIQCETLQPLYEFIFSEWTEVAATDMKKIKGRLKNREEDKDAREVCLLHTHTHTHTHRDTHTHTHTHCRPTCVC